MIHYSCDMCQRVLDPEDDVRYVIKMEVYAAMDQATDDADDERDHFQEIQEILERLDDSENEQIGDEVYQRIRFDLCPECRRRFMKDPLRRNFGKQFDFSQN